MLLLSLITISSYSQPINRKGKDFALFFAADQYQSDQLQNLPNTIKNANQIATILENDYGFQTEIVTNPSKVTIEQTLNNYRLKYQKGELAKDGQLLIFFAGHGVSVFENGYFLPIDADPDNILGTAISYDNWRPFISQLDCQHILVAVDACYSVAFDHNFGTMAGGIQMGRKNETTDQEKFLHDYNRTKARKFFTSDAKEDVVPGRSNFARKFLEGLYTERYRNRFITASALFANYIEQARPSPKYGYFEADDPNSSFLFFPLRPTTSSNTNAISDKEKDLDAYTALSIQPTIDNCRKYLMNFPQGRYRERVTQILSELTDDKNWKLAIQENTKAAYQSYLKQHPNGKHQSEAQQEINKLTISPTNPPPNMVYVAGGTFQMGDTFGDGYPAEKRVHKVTLGSYYFNRYEVTFEEYDAFCTATNHAKPDDQKWGRGKRPVMNIDWYDAIAYCNWKSQQEGLEQVYTIDKGNSDPNNLSQSNKRTWIVRANWSADGFRLPTEAEWEYAARDRGKRQKWAGTSDERRVHLYGNVFKKDKKDVYRTSPIGSFKANELGIYDLSSNVQEWCWDNYASYTSAEQKDPRGAAKGNSKVVRGGSGAGAIIYHRNSYRSSKVSSSSNFAVGFRMVRSVQ